ncbi:MAG: protease adaptor protein RcdA [Caulobacteraceae bacterium]
MIELGNAGVAVRAGVVSDFAKSALFERTFQDGMALVEDTAAYLDGLGRQESRLLGKALALAYASESMRLTTQLMQVASWLLVQRAVREGDMPATEACETRYRIDTHGQRVADAAIGASELPSALIGLVERTRQLYDRVLHLDKRMYCEEMAPAAAHPIFTQMDRVRAAFGGAA